MILFVCEGNICRSPVAAALFDAAMSGAGLDIEVASAGTRALVGAPADAITNEVAAQQGIDLSDHRARQLDRDLASPATLLLAASRSIRSDAVAIHPPSIRRSFTIRQLARILTETGFSASAGAPEERVAALRDHASRHRGRQQEIDPTLDDVIDPFRRPVSIHAEAIGQLRPALDVISRALGGAALL